ncbi:MAG: GtrA family protein [Lachnospiraceae bacterium]|nr:GtrA family protein [Lachnospiraceae bacterium]
MIDKLKLSDRMKETILYIISGALTTLVNFAASYLLYNICGINENITNAVAWTAAVIFAFFSAHIFVFKTSDKEIGNNMSPFKRFLLFAAGRVFTLVVELLATFIFVTKLGKGFWLIKVIISVVVIVLNYLISKFIVFKGNKKDKS